MPNRAVWAEVNLGAIEHNMKEIKKCIHGGAKWCAVVKADAYGHGAVAVARLAVEQGASYLAVAMLSEAVQLRSAGFTTPILILGATPVEMSGMLVDYDITQTVFELEAAEALSREAVRRGKTAKVHMKIDTGMGRIGIHPEQAGELAKQIKMLPGLELEGMFSHFALSDSKDKSYAYEQLERFKIAIKSVEEKGITIPLKHLANSAAILELPETHFDMVRAGVILYGLWPSDEVTHPIELRPGLKLCARLAYIKNVEPGNTISYGRIFKTERKSRIATIPIGYADGYTRLYSGKASAEVHGQRVPVVGRICMDQCMLDVTDVPEAREGDEAVLFGSDTLTTDEAASWLGTINYEVVCMISARVPRVYTR